MEAANEEDGLRERSQGDGAESAAGPAAEPDERVALERLTAAFAELLGTEEGAGEAADDESPDTDSQAGDPPQAIPFSPAGADEQGASGVPSERSAEPPFAVTPQTILEAMLFVGNPQNQPVSPRQAAARIRGVSPREIESLVEELNETYRREGCPYTIESSGEGYRMVLRDAFAALRDRFYGRIREVRLSQAAIDVLALVAYHPGITRKRVDEIRGKPSGAILSQMVRRQLLRIERTESKPRVTKYWTSDRFLELFGLEDLDDLPRTQELDKSM
jgi:segregation and condensation protein B